MATKTTTTKKKAASKKAAPKPEPRRRAVIVCGQRTPFVRAFGTFLTMDTIDLGVLAVRGLIDKLGITHREIDALVWGGVVLPSASPNVGREIALDLGLPFEVEAFTVTRACASGMQAISSAVSMIERGDADVVIAGGSDSTSNAEVKLAQKLIHAAAPVVMGGKAAPADYLKMIKGFWPLTDVLPKVPKIAERSTGQVMGEAAEEMAARNQISRQAQDEFAMASHHRAAKAIEDGILSAEITPVTTKEGKEVHSDGLVRAGTSLEKLSSLRSVFKKDGTLTAGNSSALTDGAAAVLLMSEEKAKQLGYTPLAAFKSWSYVGVDPGDQLLIGPAIAMPEAVEKAGLTLDDIDMVDMHEAFAAQVLCILKALASDGWAKNRLGREQAFGAIDPAKLNLYGGSLALGHPFGATGARMVTTVANELARSEKRYALLGICAAGGMGAGMVMEAVS